jgi:hypothetical protein
MGNEDSMVEMEKDEALIEDAREMIKNKQNELNYY